MLVTSTFDTNGRKPLARRRLGATSRSAGAGSKPSAAYGVTVVDRTVRRDMSPLVVVAH